MNGQYIDQGNLYITDGYVSKISTKLVSFDEEVTIEANYSNYGSTTIDIDWTKAKEHDEPTSFQEANSSLYNEMVAWKIDNVVPYLYAKPGWDNTISHTNSLYDAGHNDCYFETNKFENETAEIGGNVENYSKEELNNICFSELYTRSQNVISSLGNSQVTARILNSEELAELLFIAYNRDDEELIQINKMLDVQYDSLYSTGKDVLEKRQEKLDQEINIAAIDLTTDSILKADKKKQEEDKINEANKNRAIKEKALNILNEYEEQLDPRVFELASQEISKVSPEESKSGNSSKSNIGRTVKGFSARRVIKRKTETED